MFRRVPWPATTKCTAGYPLAPGMDYIDLFCGSEGTLGIVLEAELALLPIPEELFSAVIFFRMTTRRLTQWMRGDPSRASGCSNMRIATRSS